MGEDTSYFDLLFGLFFVTIATLVLRRFEIPFNVGLRTISAAVAGVADSLLLLLPIFEGFFII